MNEHEGETILRVADPDDLDAFMELELACHESPWSRQMYLTELSRTDGIRLAAEEDGVVVGGILGAHVGDWHLMNVLVAPQRRGHGIGGRLVDAFLERVEPAPVTLEVRVSNAPAIALYERRGFRGAGVRRRYYGGTEDALVMWRPPAGAPTTWRPPT